MDSTLQTADEINDAKAADAFGPVALATFALNPTGAHLFRAQHEQITRVMAAIEQFATRGAISDNSALGARQQLTRLTSMLSVHQSVEGPLVRRAIDSDTRMRLVLDQMDREMAPLMSDLLAFARNFSTPSSILDEQQDFFHDFRTLQERIAERFRVEERELFVAYDRIIRVSGASNVTPQGVAS